MFIFPDKTSSVYFSVAKVGHTYRKKPVKPALKGWVPMFKTAMTQWENRTDDQPLIFTDRDKENENQFIQNGEKSLPN